MSVLFFILEIISGNWCTSKMVLEDLIVSALLTSGSTFAGTAVFWLWFCPNHRCCQLPAIRKAIERDKE